MLTLLAAALVHANSVSSSQQHPPTFELTVHLRSRTSLAALDERWTAVATPSSRDYLSFLDREQLAALVGGTPAAVAEVTSWLHDLNGKDIRVSPIRDTITATFARQEVRLASGKWTARGLPKRSEQPATATIVTRRDFLPVGSGGTERSTAAEQPISGRANRSSLAAGASSYTIAAQKAAYGIPDGQAASNPQTLQMVWGPGTFGYSPEQLAAFKSEECPGINLDKIKFDTINHGKPGGDNFMEGSLDVSMISSFGMNASLLVSNTNASMSTEEGDGFGLAFLDFVTSLAAREVVPHVLSLSLGSLSPYSCQLLCVKAAATGKVGRAECDEYLQKQRQVCMYLSDEQASKIDQALMALGLRGVSIFGSSGDGGSHWSFGRFHGWGKVPRVLNEIGCEYQFPIYPSPSPYVVSVGGTEWKGGDPSNPVMWSGSGGGFSWQFPRPPHQDGPVSAYLASTQGLPPSASFNSSGRAYPDLSAVAVEGTSQSSPTMAGIFTLLTDARLSAGLKPLGPLGPRIWHVAQTFPGAAFEDVTEGNSKTSCDNGFPATKGWDPTTGWGRPVWKGLLRHFASDAELLAHTKP